MAAVEAALHTAEIVEQILLYLNAPRVLVASRVSHFWHATVKGSIQIQAALFLAPVKGRVLQPDADSALDLIANPYVNADFRRSSCGWLAVKSTLSKARLKSQSRSIATKMFITQPPCAWVRVTCEYCAVTFTVEGLGGRRTTDQTGVTLGQLVNASHTHLPLCRKNKNGKHSRWRIGFARGGTIRIFTFEDQALGEILL
ncbi:hypothetical protein CBER1_03212 [Cercospora berteroae]|uniref:F-box domain-containing protein n=1 Tax=Cercospora berteroae TaxID=357750 RepID=A0A2S6CLB7_9PEZI|nr:hypothetical protein CBER1_03212 [Cercospora berteroae]